MDDETLLIDRQEETSTLNRAWTLAGVDGPVFSLISGAAGIGKTTLLNGWVANLRPPVHIAVDLAGNFGPSTSAIIEGFEAVMEHLAYDTRSWRSGLVSSLEPDGNGIREVFPRFRGNSWFQPLAVLLDSEQLNRRFISMLKALIRTWSQRYGTILFTVENLHLADESLTQLLMQFGEPKTPLLFVATSRSEHQLPDQRIDIIRLNPFTSEQVRQWIIGAFPTESPLRLDFYLELFRNAGGNPLYLREIQRLLRHEGDSRSVEPSIVSWFDRKIQNLPPPLRRFVDAGAVLGSTFHAETARLCAGLEVRSAGLVADGITLGLLVERNGVCSWVHDLIRDALLRSLNPVRRLQMLEAAARGVIRSSDPTREQILMLPGFIGEVVHTIALSKFEAELTIDRLIESVSALRGAQDNSKAREALATVRTLSERFAEGVSDEVWLLSAQLAFEAGQPDAAAEYARNIRPDAPPAVKNEGEFILYRCLYLRRDFRHLYNNVLGLSRTLTQSRILTKVGPLVAGLALGALFPLLVLRLSRMKKRRISAKRETGENRAISFVFFTFQYFNLHSAFVCVLIAVRSVFRRNSPNLPVVALLSASYSFLPRFAWHSALRVAQLAAQRQLSVGNPYWTFQTDFLHSLFHLPAAAGLRNMWAKHRHTISASTLLVDPEFETIMKFDMRNLFFWTDVPLDTLSAEFRTYVSRARRGGNGPLADMLGTLLVIFESSMNGVEEPFRIAADEDTENAVIHEMQQRGDTNTASAIRVIQAFFALLSCRPSVAKVLMDDAAAIGRDTTYWLSRVFDSYTGCLAAILSGAELSTVAPQLAMLRRTSARYGKDFLPYVMHIEAELARQSGDLHRAGELYHSSSAQFRRIGCTVLSAFVDTRTGNLFESQNEPEIARAYFDRAIKGYAQAKMNSAIMAIRRHHPAVPGTVGSDDDYLTVALKLHRLTLLGKLASETTHEIKNMNHAIRLSAEGLGKDIDAVVAGENTNERLASVARGIAAIRDSASTISAYIEQFRLIGSESSTSEMRKVNLSDILRDSVDLMRPIINRSTRRFRDETSGSQIFVIGKPSRIEQLVTNLLLNACESLPTVNHGIILRWSANPGDGRVGFQVIDEGRGIPAEVLPRVCDPFFTTKREHGGTGLGLSVCKQIVEEHNGTLRIESNIGQGTAVSALFPVGT